MTPREFLDSCTQLDKVGFGRRDGSINVHDDVEIVDFDGKKLPVKFNHVDGNFKIRRSNLITLVGCPSHVGGNFSLLDSKVVDLTDGPAVVGGTYHVSHGNWDLKSLRGVAKLIEFDFNAWRDPPFDYAEFRYLLLSQIKGKITTGNTDVDYILQHGRDDNWIMPKHLIPNKINQLREISKR